MSNLRAQREAGILTGVLGNWNDMFSKCSGDNEQGDDGGGSGKLTAASRKRGGDIKAKSADTKHNSRLMLDIQRNKDRSRSYREFLAALGSLAWPALN